MAQGALFAEFPSEPSAQEIKSSINRDGFVPLPFALGRSACDELFDGYQTFIDACMGPDGQQFIDAVTFDVNGRGNGAFQFVYRVPGQINPNEPDRAPGADHKFIFHHGSQTTRRAKAALGGELPAEFREFFANMDDYYLESWKTMMIGAKALGLGGVVFSGDHDDDIIHNRMLSYKGVDLPILGEDHVDRSLFTGANFENKSGLRGVPGQNGYLEPVTEEYLLQKRAELKPIAHVEGEAKFFLGAGANHLPPKARAGIEGLPLLIHDIVNDHPGEERLSAVSFVNPHNKYQGYDVPTKHETGIDDIIAHIRSLEADESVA